MFAEEPVGGKDIVGDDWVMTDLSGADDPTAPTGALSGLDLAFLAHPLSDVVPGTV